ncbi:MAG: TonB-dependent receptor [Acidobacteriia bacterium]|nr:TonB-dependent receptor [Terriglobia bacterium]
MLTSMRLRFRCLVLLVVVAVSTVVLFSTIVLAQAETATLSGVVTDPQGAVVPGVEVVATRIETGTTLTTESNGAGIYFFTGLMPGHYHLVVRKQGFKEIAIKEVELHVQDKLERNFSLDIGSLSETVNVEGGTSLINTQDATVSTVVDRQFVGNMPLNGRSFQSLLTLTPGIVSVVSGGSGNVAGFSQFSVNGQRAVSNAFIVDGVSANVGANPGSINAAFTAGDAPGLTAFGTTQSMVSVDDLEEFKVQTSSYAAEYGRQPGGQISIVTRSGTNQFHGSAFDYLRNDVLDANDWFADQAGQPKPPERQNDFGGTLGGPIIIPKLYNGKDRTFFFFSYEGLRLRLPQFNLTDVPTLALRQTAPAGLRPILNAFPLPNGRDLGNGFAEFTAAYSDPSSLNATSIRVDHTINNKWTLFGRYNHALSSNSTRRQGINLSTVDNPSTDTQTITVGATAALTPSITNQLRANYSYFGANSHLYADNFGGATPLPLSYFVPSQYGTTANQGAVLFLFSGLTVSNGPNVDLVDYGYTRQRQLNIVDNFSDSRGSHQLKFGVDYRRLTPALAFNNYVFSATYTSLQNLLNNVNTARVNAGSPSRPVYLNFSAYGQDTWKLSRRLTFTLGLRWELNPPPRNATGVDPLAVTSIANLATMQVAPQGSSRYKTTYNNFAPRIGVAYQLSQTPGRETVVRGGFGVFYDTGNDQNSYPFQGFPFNGTRLLTNISFPLSPAQVAPVPVPVSVIPPYGIMVVTDPSLKLPYTLQWSFAVEQSLGKNQALTVSYVGAAGRRLLQTTQYMLAKINPAFTTVNLQTNNATSDYDALQSQFERRLSRGLQALVSYTWSHALDDDSAPSTVFRLAKRGNADFDIRHNFAAAVSYDIPVPGKNSTVETILGHWSLDTTLHVHSALPLDLIATTLIDPATGNTVNVRPNVNPGVPNYIDDPSVPSGRRINSAAFSIPPTGQSGTLGRNVLRGLPASQVDLALWRQIHLVERLSLQLRAEAFNVFNHPNFGNIQTSLTAVNFGQATGMLNRQLQGLSTLYQIGGPRSLQLSLKLVF